MSSVQIQTDLADSSHARDKFVKPTVRRMTLNSSDFRALLFYGNVKRKKTQNLVCTSVTMTSQFQPVVNRVKESDSELHCRSLLFIGAAADV